MALLPIRRDLRFKLINLLAGAFPERGDLELLSAFALDVDLANITDVGDNGMFLCMKLVRWCETHGDELLKQLMLAAIEMRPERRDLLDLADNLGIRHASETATSSSREETNLNIYKALIQLNDTQWEDLLGALDIPSTNIDNENRPRQTRILIREMEVSGGLGLLEDAVKSLLLVDASRMPWSFYYNRVLNVARYLVRGSEGSNGYRPDVILGISNGGMVFADVLTWKLSKIKLWSQSAPEKYREWRGVTPIWTLWANRSNIDIDRFENPVNDSILNALFETTRNQTVEQPLNILLIDDIIASGTTSKRALQYFKKRSAELEGLRVEIRFLPLFNRNPIPFTGAQELRDSLLWFNPPFNTEKFNFTEPSVLRMLDPNPYFDLPYEKEIRQD